MVKLNKTAILSGVAAVMVAILGAILLMSQPALSKNDKPKESTDGLTTTLGF